VIRSALVLLLALASTARADSDDIVARSLVEAPGSFDIRLVTEVWLRRDFVAHPLSYSPDIYWGATPRLTVGLIHSAASLDRIDAGQTFCLLPSALQPCQHLYRGSGFDVIYSLLSGPFALAPRIRGVIRDIQPYFLPALTVGALARWTHGRFAITSDPYLRIPLDNHQHGNRLNVNVPIWFAVQPIDHWAIALHTGFDGDWYVINDGWHMPLALVNSFRLNPQLDLTIEAGWTKLLGPQHDIGVGALMVTAGYRTN